MEAVGDILVLPFFGQGHLNPSVELCKHLSSYGECKVILIIPSHLSSSIPSTLHQQYPSIEVLAIEASDTPSPPPPSWNGTGPPPPPPDFPESEGARLGPNPFRPHGQYPSIEVLAIEASYASLPPPPSSIGTGPPPTPPDFPESEVARPGPNPFRPHGHQELGGGIESFLSERYKNVPGQTRPGCVVMDLMMGWGKEIFLRENIPILSFFTTGACSTAMEYASWKAQARDMKPGETRVLEGLPECVALRYSDLEGREHRGPPGHGFKKADHHEPAGKPNGPNFGLRDPGDAPRWLDEVDDSKAKEHRGSPGHGFKKPDHHEPAGKPKGPDFGLRDQGEAPRWLDEGDDSKALLINTCHELEGPFLDYVSNLVKKPVFGVGPLLPEKYWKSIGTIVHDRDSRSNRKSNYTEDEIIQWLDSKPSQSVIYISFGSEVGPKLEEYAQIADALGDSKWSFIWVIQPGSGKHGGPPNIFGDKPNSSNNEEGFYPHGLEEKIGNRGLIIKGWAPQLLILSHPSTGGFLSHCGWNSTVEAIGRGIPILAWPIRGDQFYDAKLVVGYLKIGLMVSSGDRSEIVRKDDIIKGIDGLMDNKEVHERAMALRGIFEDGYPSSSVTSIKALIELIRSN